MCTYVVCVCVYTCVCLRTSAHVYVVCTDDLICMYTCLCTCAQVCAHTMWFVCDCKQLCVRVLQHSSVAECERSAP